MGNIFWNSLGNALRILWRTFSKDFWRTVWRTLLGNTSKILHFRWTLLMWLPNQKGHTRSKPFGEHHSKHIVWLNSGAIGKSNFWPPILLSPLYTVSLISVPLYILMTLNHMTIAIKHRKCLRNSSVLIQA